MNKSKLSAEEQRIVEGFFGGASPQYLAKEYAAHHTSSANGGRAMKFKEALQIVYKALNKISWAEMEKGEQND